MDAIILGLEAVEEDHPIPNLARRMLLGENMLWAHVRLTAGCHLATHTHPNEQIAFRHLGPRALAARRRGKRRVPRAGSRGRHRGASPRRLPTRSGRPRRHCDPRRAQPARTHGCGSAGWRGSTGPISRIGRIGPIRRAAHQPATPRDVTTAIATHNHGRPRLRYTSQGPRSDS